ncbi:hypothetical protein AB205_0097930, partial [Aquarana catesbeiana]
EQKTPFWVRQSLLLRKPDTPPPPEVEDGRSSIYESVVTNTSKEMMCYSDFPIPEGYPNFLHNTKMMEYYKQYAERFGLLKYIQFNFSSCLFPATSFVTWFNKALKMYLSVGAYIVQR